MRENKELLLPLIETERELEEEMSKPSPEVVKVISELDGDIIILGVGGKMGPSLAKLVKRAIKEAGVDKKVIGVSRFSSPEIKKELEDFGIETIRYDLLDQNSLDELPDIPNVIFMAGRKFGSTGNEPLTWAMNTFLPGIVVKKFKDSKIVALSTGNVYPLVSVESPGSKESDSPGPIGEYAQSCLGRERIFQYFCSQFKTPATLIRLNYAIDLRYGVLLDVAQKVFNKIPIDLTMGYVNVIWQGDANSFIIRAFTLCEVPPKILNVTGPETVSIRSLAMKFGEIFKKKPVFKNKEAETALLSDASQCHNLFGYPKVTLKQMIGWVAHWVLINGPTLNKPTHYQEREGRF